MENVTTKKAVHQKSSTCSKFCKKCYKDILMTINFPSAMKIPLPISNSGKILNTLMSCTWVTCTGVKHWDKYKQLWASNLGPEKFRVV